MNGLAWQPRLTEFEETVLAECPNITRPYAPLISAGFVTKEEYQSILNQYK